MEDWISLLTLDSQTSSQIVSEDFLKRIAEDLKEAIPISKDNFETLTKALSDKFTCFVFDNVPADFYRVLRCLCDHLIRRADVAPIDISNFFLGFVEVFLKVSPDCLVPTYECILDVIHQKIIDINFSVYIKHAILSSLNEITVISSTKKVELFLKPKVFAAYTLLASNLRAIGDYDTQTQLLEFLLHVIPSARRRYFVERFIHPDFADLFCAIIGQNFTTAARKFLNLLNSMNPSTQSVFSLPCIGIQICGHEVRFCFLWKTAAYGDHFWIDFNLVPQRITANCVLAGQAAQTSYTSDDGNEQIWETISLHPEIINEVNVSSIFTKDKRGTQVEQINLSITTFESPSDYVRFWDGDSSPHRIPEEDFVTIEFCLGPSDVVRNAPTKAPGTPIAQGITEASQSQDQQLISLLTGLRVYAEVSLALLKVQYYYFVVFY
ncbi:unnamed protein product [Rodentolepis nana]|uniref:SYCP2_SLD domain-containing protein n=1 Tax=Rodentolepis nana TaxID=102285 RepID=A0A0R3TZZ8_RODNA|nr:unnamed protein product [Rodentolepis nana]